MLTHVVDPTQKIATPRNILELDAEYEKVRAATYFARSESEQYRNKWMTDREAKRVLAELAQDPTIKLPSRLADVLQVRTHWRPPRLVLTRPQITEIDPLATHAVTFYAHHCKAWQILRAIIRREVRTEVIPPALRSVLRSATRKATAPCFAATLSPRR